MGKSLKIIYEDLKEEFIQLVDFEPISLLGEKRQEQLPVDYFQFYNSVSSVYSSKIEGENIDFDSFFKHKFMKVPYQPDYTKRSDDLYSAYEFILKHPLIPKNIFKSHEILSRHLLPKDQRGKIRNNPMYVINEEDRIEYVACEPYKVRKELDKLFSDIENLQKTDLTVKEVFYYASLVHLVFVKIHPMQDGNGRTGRLIEKWFLIEKLGELAVSIELEKNYYQNRREYYSNIRKLGLDYETLDYSQSLDFTLMTINSINKK